MGVNKIKKKQANNKFNPRLPKAPQAQGNLNHKAPRFSAWFCLNSINTACVKFYAYPYQEGIRL